MGVGHWRRGSTTQHPAPSSQSKTNTITHQDTEDGKGGQAAQCGKGRNAGGAGLGGHAAHPWALLHVLTLHLSKQGRSPVGRHAASLASSPRQLVPGLT